MADFWTVFSAVFLAEIASIPVKRYFTPNANSILDKIEALMQRK